MDAAKHEFEYRIIKHLRNIYSAPLDTYVNFEHLSDAQKRKRVFDDGYRTRLPKRR